MNEIQKACLSIEHTRRRQSFVIRWVVIPYAVVYLMAYAYIIFWK
jgi:hypothetical protein